MRRKHRKIMVAIGFVFWLTVSNGPLVDQQGVYASSHAPVHANLLVVGVAFPGLPATKPLSLYQNLYFGRSHSVADYYRQVSYGDFLLGGRVVGNPLQPGKFLLLPHPESYYAKTDNGSDGNFPNNDDGLVAAVIHELVRDHFDFAPFVSHGTFPIW